MTVFRPLKPAIVAFFVITAAAYFSCPSVTCVLIMNGHITLYLGTLQLEVFC